MTNFIPHTPEERQAMLARIGIESEAALFEAVPAGLKDDFTLSELPATGMTELELQLHLQALSSQNQGPNMPSFLGGGAYAAVYSARSE